MVAVYGNLMVMGVTVALLVATLNLGKREPRSSKEPLEYLPSAQAADPSPGAVGELTSRKPGRVLVVRNG